MELPDGLVQKAQAGDRSAFGQIYEGHFAMVYRYVAARVGQGAEAEDLTQEVFLRAMRSIGRYTHAGTPLAAWLFRIAHNLVVDRSRRTRASPPPLPLEDAAAVGGSGSVEEDALRAVQAEGLLRSMERLTELQRQVVLLRFMAGLSLAETAAVLGKKENAIKSLQHSALMALRRLILPGASGPKEER